MTLTEYYKIIKTKIENNDFSFKARDKSLVPTREFCQKNSHLESIHYLMFEFMLDRNDKRKSDVFDYICAPKDVNIKDVCDIDFTTWNTSDFLREVMKLKD